MLDPIPRRFHKVLLPVSSSVASAFPKKETGRLPQFLANTTFREAGFRGCRYFFMFRPPSLLVSQIVPTAAILPQGSRDFYFRAERASLPPHAPDMLTVRIQAIDGTRTFTLLDSQPCRLLILFPALSLFPGATPDHELNLASVGNCFISGPLSARMVAAAWDLMP